MHKEFTQKVLDSIQKNFSYMIDQNQGSEDGIKNGLKAITEHMFGNHTFCNVSWCGGLTKGDAYKHLNLPYGKDLTSKQLKADLEKIFQNKLLTKANQLSKLSSSQANESFNNTVASKAPKRLHYSGSASLGYRVCSAVLQKNEGYEYMSKVNEAAGLSPGNKTLKRAGKLNIRRDRKSVKSKSKEWKTNRIKLKQKRLAKNVSKELREGKTYETELGSIQCQNGWFKKDNQCYFFSNDERNWNDAKSICKSYDSMLVEVISSCELDFLKTKATTYDASFWLGGTDIEQEGNWIWSSSQTDITFTDWSAGRPNNSNGDEQCLQMKRSYHMVWNEDPCSEEKHFICEKQ